MGAASPTGTCSCDCCSPDPVAAVSTPQEPSSYHWAVEKNGYPTEYEQLVSKKQYIEGVSCPVCGSQQQTVRFKGTNFRCAPSTNLPAAVMSCAKGQLSASCRQGIGTTPYSSPHLSSHLSAGRRASVRRAVASTACGRLLRRHCQRCSA